MGGKTEHQWPVTNVNQNMREVCGDYGVVGVGLLPSSPGKTVYRIHSPPLLGKRNKFHYIQLLNSTPTKFQSLEELHIDSQVF